MDRNEILRGKKLSREQVYVAVDGEREYQEARWNPETTPSGGRHELGAYLIFIDDYLREAKTQLSRGADPKATQDCLNTLRKITALGVACMEEHGAPARK